MLEAFERWDLRQAGLFTFAASPKHLGLYQKYGFWPGSLTVVMTKAIDAQARSPFTLVSKETENGRVLVLDEISGLTDQVFHGLDLGRAREHQGGSSGSSTPARYFAAESELGLLVAGVNTGRLDAYRRLLARGYRAERVGVSMWLHPEGPHFDTPDHYVLDDLR